MQAQ
ncbi:putative hemoglobin and hemoglobin-haptoglobin-binding protein 3 precursor, partial [Haemophilus influenzae]